MGPDSSDAVNCTLVALKPFVVSNHKEVETDANGEKRDFISVGKTVATVCQCLPI